MLSRQLYQPKWEFTFYTCYMSPLCPFRQLCSSHRMVLTSIFLRTSDGKHLLPILLLSNYFSGKGSIEIYFQIKKYKVFLIVEFWTFLSFVHYVEFVSVTWFVFYLFWTLFTDFPLLMTTLHCLDTLIVKYRSAAPLTLFFPKPSWMF